MESENTAPEEQAKDAVAAEVNQENITKESQVQEEAVSYSSYRKLLGEKKKTQEALHEMQVKLREFEDANLEAKGQKDELIGNLKESNKTLETQLKERELRFAWKAVKNDLKTELLKLNCDDPDKVIRLIDKDDMDSLEIDENYKINPEDLNRVVSKAKKENHWFFGGKKVNLQDSVPSNQVNTKRTLKDVPLSEQLKALVTKNYKE